MEYTKHNQRQFHRFEFLNNLDTGVMKILIPYLLIKMGISMSVFGLALSFQPLMNIVFRYISSCFSDKYGRKKMAIIGQTIGAIGLLGYLFMSNVYHYIVIEIVRAFAMVLFVPSYAAWKKESSDDENRIDFLMKLSRNRIVGTAVGGGLIIAMGYLIRTFKISIFGYEIHEQHFFSIFFLFEFSAVFLLLTMRDMHIEKKVNAIKIKIKDSVHDWNVFIFMMYNTIVLSLTSAMALPFVTAYLTERTNMSIDKIGAFFAISSIAAVLLAQKITRRLKFGRPFKMIGILLLFEGISSFFIPFDKGIILFTFVWLLYQIFQTSVDALNSSQEQRIIKANTAKMLQFTGIAGSIGSIIGNNIGGLIWHNIGSSYTFWIAGMMIFIIGLTELFYDAFIKKTEFGLPVNIKKMQEA